VRFLARRRCARCRGRQRRVLNVSTGWRRVRLENRCPRSPTGGLTVGRDLNGIEGTLISCRDARYGSLFRGPAPRRPGHDRICVHVSGITARVQVGSLRMFPRIIRYGVYGLHPG
jgi:hypothetical protein